jgi:uncharacterized membrane protein
LLAGLLLIIIGVIFAIFGIGGTAKIKLEKGGIVLTITGVGGIILIIVGVILLGV